MSDTMVVDNERKIPGAETFDLSRASAAAAADSEAERNTVFGSLVGSDADIVGLVAYSIYKQNKHDWLIAFGKNKSREPNEAELNSYIIGESTPRRLATYRHLAQATLEGRGPDVGAGYTAGQAGQGFDQHSLGNAQRGGAAAISPVMWIGGFIVVLAAAWLAAHYGYIKV